jgi:hypothetical protein
MNESRKNLMTTFPKSVRIQSVTLALTISLGLIVLLALLIAWERKLAPLVIATVLGTSIWATIDSFRIDLPAYKTPIALHPMVLFNLMYLLWVPLFPWYLVVRTRILAGTMPRKDLGARDQSIASLRRR